SSAFIPVLPIKIDCVIEEKYRALICARESAVESIPGPAYMRCRYVSWAVIALPAHASLGNLTDGYRLIEPIKRNTPFHLVFLAVVFDFGICALCILTVP